MQLKERQVALEERKLALQEKQFDFERKEREHVLSLNAIAN